MSVMRSRGKDAEIVLVNRCDLIDAIQRAALDDWLARMAPRVIAIPSTCG